jgi:hypothetical protein
MRNALLLTAVHALLLACGGDGDDNVGPDGDGDGDGNVGPGERRLAFTVQPSTITAGQVMTPAVQVSVADAAGHPVTSGTATIALTLSGSPTTTLNGQTTRPASNGVAV